jgi:nucleotide-binding universal stress UspA family protein
VLIALKGTPRSARELLGIVQLGATAELDLVVVHVDDEDTIPAFSDQAQYDTQDYANEFLTRYCRGAPEARLVLRVGLPVDEILATVDDVDPDMLAIGWPHTSDPNRARVAREIVTRSHVPVLVAATKDPTT